MAAEIRQNWLKSLLSGTLALILAIHVPVAVAKDNQLEIHNLEYSIAQTSLLAHIQLNTARPQLVVEITGYSSTADQTDDSPFITASNTHVADGIVAANFLPFGTHIQIPKLFGNKIFRVEDRMHRRFNGRVDIWFSSRAEAEVFGLHKTEIVIL